MDDTTGPADHADLSNSPYLAFLMLLESLSPTERAVFLLREGFGYGYDEVAAAVGEPAASCRQIFARARRHVAAGRPRFLTSHTEEDGAGI
jgi:DNA-directed RNA polymerase specialized sigma24 family protein